MNRNAGLAAVAVHRAIQRNLNGAALYAQQPRVPVLGCLESYSKSQTVHIKRLRFGQVIGRQNRHRAFHSKLLYHMRSLLCVFTLATCLQAQPAKSNRTEVDRIFSAFNTHTPGCAVGVSQHGKVTLTAGYGMADLERAVPIKADTVFESGSVAKQFTAMALLLLAQQGKISLDDPLRKYLPELPDYGAPLTVRHVLSHTSGLREWRLPARLSGTPEGSYVLAN
jgi:Beta-lactamase